MSNENSKKIKTGIGFPHEVTKDQLEITYFRGSGPGGQRRNKTSNACRIKHLPTGHTTQATEHRSQEQNRKAAFHKLCDILIPIMKHEVRKERYLAGVERVRTYKEKQDLVIDDRVENKVFSYKDILDGNLDDLIKDVILKSNN